METRLKILIVDDELPILRIYQRSLDRGGYQPLLEPSVDNLVRMASAADIALCIVDLTELTKLPKNALEDVWSAHPSLPILISTGHDESSLPQHIRHDPRVSFLGKPWLPAQLLETVGKLLGGPR